MHEVFPITRYVDMVKCAQCVVVKLTQTLSINYIGVNLRCKINKSAQSTFR